MSFEKSFCPSPWFHMRINSQGNYEYCRWATKDRGSLTQGLHNTDIVKWFQQDVSNVRQQLLNGESPPGCSECRVMEKHGKVSGRQRQLLKIGVTLENFASSINSTQWKEVFTDSLNNKGNTDQYPQDWQIDLGNYCNSACLFCSPYSSSRLATEQKKLGIINQLPPRNWTDDPVLLEKFLSVLKNSKKISYLHFIGGETLITPAFAKILSALIESKLHLTVAIGFTTNLTVWDDSVVDLLCQFREVNLGMSIECFHPVNDYARYGGNLTDTKHYLEKWLKVANQQNWLTQLRTTPTVLTALHLDTVYQFALANNINVESCNFLNKPEFMRPSVLPAEYRNVILNKLQKTADLIPMVTTAQLINTRNKSTVNTQLSQDIGSYIDYLTHAEDESRRLPELIKYLKLIESNRKNSVLDYLPEYEKLFRTAGY